MDVHGEHSSYAFYSSPLRVLRQLLSPLSSARALCSTVVRLHPPVYAFITTQCRYRSFSPVRHKLLDASVCAFITTQCRYLSFSPVRDNRLDASVHAFVPTQCRYLFFTPVRRDRLDASACSFVFDPVQVPLVFLPVRVPRSASTRHPAPCGLPVEENSPVRVPRK